MKPWCAPTAYAQHRHTVEQQVGVPGQQNAVLESARFAFVRIADYVLVRVLRASAGLQDRVGLDLFTSGQAAFYNTGPNLIREVRANNPGLYGYLDVVPAPVGKSGVVGKGLMALSVKGDTKYPNASLALAQFLSNPQSMLEFSKIVSIYPSTPASYDDPFFSAEPVAIEASAKPYAKDAGSKLADIVPPIPNKAEVNEIVLQAVQQALFNGVDPQTALSDAVDQANALLP